MKNLSVGLAVSMFLLVPSMAVSQEAEEEQAGPPPTGVVTMSTFKVPLGEERGKVMEFIERVVAPQERNNPNVRAFYVLQHYYGSDSRDVMTIRVYDTLADIEAPCGEPCQKWAEENLPGEGEEGYEELVELGQTFVKYNGQHSDEIYSARLDLAKN